MTVLFYFFLFVFGTAVGSFLGVIVDRVMGSEPIWKGRSHCDHCRHHLSWLDLFPILSFLLLQRKCRYCQHPLSWFYPIIELLTGLTFVVVTYVLFMGAYLQVFNLNYSLLLLYYLTIVSSCLTIFFTDIRYGIIPFKVVFFAAAVSIVWYLLLPALYFQPSEMLALGLQTNLVNAVLSGAGAFLFFFLLFYLTKGRGMGFGDVVFVFLMGLILGFPNIGLALYIAFITGALVAVFLVLAKFKKFKGGTIPFGPFLVFGTIVSLLYGNFLMHLLMSYLL